MCEAGDLLLVFVPGVAVTWASRRFKFPNAVAQVVLGILVGRAVFGWVAHGSALHDLGQLSVVLLLGSAGLELGIDRLRAAGWAAVTVAILASQ